MSTQGNSGKRKNWGTWIVLGGAALLVGGVVIAASSLMFGGISGEEFSPDNFDRRVFSYFELPLVRVQVTPVHRLSTGKGLEGYLQGKYPPPAGSAANPRYDLVKMTGVKPQSEKCDARILCAYFDSVNESGTSYWLQWSRDKPALAKVFWPVVIKAARQQLYLFVPDLIECARQATDAKQLALELDRVMAREYLEFAEMQQQLEHHEAAVTLYTEALVHAPRDKSALLGRAKAYEALGQGDDAAADLAEAVKSSPPPITAEQE